MEINPLAGIAIVLMIVLIALIAPHLRKWQ